MGGVFLFSKIVFRKTDNLTNISLSLLIILLLNPFEVKDIGLQLSFLGTIGIILFSKKGKETEYSIRAVPIGGFCQLAGEDLDDDDAKKVPKNRRLQSKSAWQRFLIMFFGAGNNFISAILIIFIIGLIMYHVIQKHKKNMPIINCKEICMLGITVEINKNNIFQ